MIAAPAAGPLLVPGHGALSSRISRALHAERNGAVTCTRGRGRRGRGAPGRGGSDRGGGRRTAARARSRTSRSRPGGPRAGTPARARRRPPAGQHRHLAAIGEGEARDVERVGVAVLGQAPAALVVHRPARIGGGDGELRDARARWRRAAGSTNVVTQRSTCGTIGQRRSAAGLNATRPPFAAAISNGREAPHTLGPPSAERPRSQAVSRTVPEVRQACSSSTRRGSCLATKSGPVLHPTGAAARRRSTPP